LSPAAAEEKRQVPFALNLLVLTLAAAAPGGAAEAIHLTYDAPPECPSREAFEQQIRLRCDGLRAAEPQERARSFVVAVVQQGALFEGTLTVRDLDAQETSRSFSSARCDEVTSALALVAAAAIELRAGRTPVEPRPKVEPPKELPPEVAVPAPPLAPRRGWLLGVGAHLGVTGGASSRPLFGGAAFVELENARDSVWSPLVRVGVKFVPGQDVPVGEAAARFSLVSAAAEVCPLEALAASRVSLRPCVRLEAGALTASGLYLPDPKTATRPWLAPAVVGRVRVRTWGSLSLELEAAAAFPLVRDRFYFGPDATVHQVPAVTASAGAGASVSIW
jgi:hypothetical protein